MKSKFTTLAFIFSLYSICNAQTYCSSSSVPDPFNWTQSSFQMYLEPQGSRLIPNPYHADGAFLNPNIEALAWWKQ